jgi:hypothetical protein
MKWIFAAIIMAALVGPALAQERTGGGGSGPRRAPDAPNLGFPIRVSGEVIQVDSTRNAIQIRDTRRKRDVGFALDAKCKIKADEKQFGKKELKLDEIETGFLVDLTVRQADLVVIEMKVKKPKKEDEAK